MQHNLFAAVEKRRITIDGTNYQKAAGTTDVLTSGAIDMFGYTSLAIAEDLGAVTNGGACTVKLQQSDDDGSTDAYSDIAGTLYTIADADDNKAVLYDVFAPSKRYVKVITTRATQNLAVDSLNAFLFRAHLEAVTQGATVANLATFNHPAEGTA